ncbi:hypothetical protein AMJ44_03955 [candidate division WOR-1 bacterium DG_54_3]|uniref:Methyltransferase domain-containing protein n=1 Tax=candidate division WOR-1 bacterium DG_54_3 TaxID=1703775 RepID=A0A0S7Y3W7_UNCSA|nr:MAG: hypothetical protein AMJ44_03955 [candidate division WOR-1 bacterium DG_54_3]
MIPTRIAPNLIAKEIVRISRVVRSSEKKYFSQKFGEQLTDILSIQTSAPNKGSYQCTSPFSFNGFLSMVDLPSKGRFIDLGHGFGCPCFVAKNYFEDVVGIEGDRDLFEFSIRNRSILDPRYQSVDLRFGNFLGKDLSSFNVIYFSRPFDERFEERMGEKLLKVKSGAKIISYFLRNINYKDLFPSSNFHEIVWDSSPFRSFLLFEKI